MDNVSSVRLDVTVHEDIENAVEFVRDEGRGLNGVVNNPGVGTISSIVTGSQSSAHTVTYAPPASAQTPGSVFMVSIAAAIAQSTALPPASAIASAAFAASVEVVATATFIVRG